MSRSLFTIVSRIALTVRMIAIASLLQATISPADATETKEATPVSGSAEIYLSALPVIGTPGQTRTVFVQQVVRHGGRCGPVDATIDTSLIDSQNLVVVSAKVRQGYFCGPLMSGFFDLPYRFDFEIVPGKMGPLTIRWELNRSEITLQTVAVATRSQYDANGMWFEAATNGSGIALHHRRATSDLAFGTWFLFDNFGVGRWYTLQSANWQQDGSVLEGLLYRVEGNCKTANLTACPGPGTFRDGTSRNAFWQLPSVARITFQSSTRAYAEVSTLGGAVQFTSELTKLQF